MATEKNHILTPLDLFDWESAEKITEYCQKRNLNEKEML